MGRPPPAILVAALAIIIVYPAPATASFHVMQIEQVIGGVNGDPTAQAIQLRMRTGLQNQVQNGRLVAHDAAGNNPIVVATFPGALPNQGTGVRVLVASANFGNYTNPPVAADRLMSALIPASYLAAGS